MKVKAKLEKKELDFIPKFTGRFTQDGGLSFGTYIKMALKKFIKENPNMPFELKPLLPESQKQRGFFEGAICPLVAFYQEGMDHHNSQNISDVREWLKIEFNGQMMVVGGKSHIIGGSTKKKLNQGFLERIIGYLQDNYAPPDEILDPECYKDWRDRIYPYGGPDNYIDYLVELKILTK